jgi:hypothetical protein
LISSISIKTSSKPKLMLEIELTNINMC